MSKTENLLIWYSIQKRIFKCACLSKSIYFFPLIETCNELLQMTSALRLMFVLYTFSWEQLFFCCCFLASICYKKTVYTFYSVFFYPPLMKSVKVKMKTGGGHCILWILKFIVVCIFSLKLACSAVLCFHIPRWSAALLRHW